MYVLGKIPLFIFMTFLEAGLRAEQGSGVAIFGKSKDSVVRICAYDSDHTPIRAGTGFVVEGGLIATAFHVVRDAVHIQITCDTVVCETQSVVACDSALDYILFEIDRVNLPSVECGHSESMKIGEEIYAIGYSENGSLYGTGPSITCGLICAKGLFKDKGRILPLIKSDLKSPSSYSGSPIFNTKNEVIGLIRFVRAYGPSREPFTFITPIEHVVNIRRFRVPKLLPDLLRK
jgi:S1-C subfamily serine protease